MAKHLSKLDVSAIIDLIRSWPDEKLTWDAICDESESIIGKRPSRQSLNSNVDIKHAYNVKKKNLSVQLPSVAVPSSLKVAADRIDNLQNQVAELKAMNSLLNEKFITWQYNAYKHGITEDKLNQPLPKIDRERSHN